MSSQNMEEIYIEYSKQVYKFLFCLTRDDSLSEELTQETFSVALKEIKKFRGECKLYVWLCQIAKHLYYKEVKRNRKINSINLEHIEVAYNNQEEESINKIYLYDQINKLDNRTKEIIYLRLIGDLTFKEIGEILGISENLSRVIFYRGKQKIKESDYNEKE